jgi:hypothetical protein
MQHTDNQGLERPHPPLPTKINVSIDALPCGIVEALIDISGTVRDKSPVSGKEAASRIRNAFQECVPRRTVTAYFRSIDSAPLLRKRV